MLKVVFRPRATQDLLDISNYTKAQYGHAKAKRYLEDLRNQVERVAGFPGMGSDVFGLPPKYRKVRSGSHRAIYRYTETELIVVRVVHEREDVPDEIEDFW